MFKLLRSAEAAQYGSAALVFVTAEIIGHEAAVGMNSAQWAWGAVSVLGSISVAVMVHLRSAKAKAPANPRDRRG